MLDSTLTIRVNKVERGGPLVRGLVPHTVCPLCREVVSRRRP